MLRPRVRSRAGQVLLIVAMSAVALAGVAGLAIDGARILVEQRNLQNAVDGAALTGALDLGPGAGSSQLSTALDDTVYAIEQSLGLDFSNNYTVGHHLVSNPCHGVGCNSGTSPSGPYNPSNAGSGPCCNNWVDRSGAYTLTVTTPYTYVGTVEPEAFIKVILIHNLTLVIAPGFGAVPVRVQTIARNHAIPYAIFDFKRNDKADMSANGATTLTANKRVGVNGSVSMPTNSLTFNCTTPPTPSGYGGDLWEYTVPATGPITAGSITENGCPGSVSPSLYKALGGYLFPPNVHLPNDPCLTISCGAVQGSITISGTEVLTPTRSSDPTQGIGPRYSLVTVPNSATLILQPGVYFFEGTASSSGLRVASGGILETGDCYLDPVNPPACWTPQSGVAPTVCTAGPLLDPVYGGHPFHCTADDDFGVLLVFWPAGAATDPSSSCTNVNPTGSTNYYCLEPAGSSGSYNQLLVQGGGIIFISSSPKYHAVSIYVDASHPSPSATWNFTRPTDLSPAGCVSNACALQIGLGSHVVYVQGGSSSSINGAILAPDDNSFLGGAGSGDGFGQILAYTTSFIGNAAIVEGYNPVALAYVPVIVQ